MDINKTSQKNSQKRFVILLIVVELIVAIIFCVCVRYDSSIEARQKSDGQLEGMVRIYFY